MQQKEWKLERQKNIRQTLTDLETNLGVAKGEYTEEIKSHCKEIFKYYREELKKLIKENEEYARRTRHSLPTIHPSKRRIANSRTRYQRLMPTPFCVFAARRIHKSPNLDGCDWYYISDFSKHCCYSWRNLFATKNANFDQSYIDTFLSAVEEMSGGTDNTVSISGSNGSADQLTNWDVTKKLGLAAPEKKKGGGYSH